MLSHLLLASAAPGSPAIGHWLTEVEAFHAELHNRSSESLLGRINLEPLWQRAVRDASRKAEGLNRTEEELRAIAWLELIPETCPFTLEQLCSPDFILNPAVGFPFSLPARRVCNPELAFKPG
jgi:hypothetical protein